MFGKLRLARRLGRLLGMSGVGLFLAGMGMALTSSGPAAWWEGVAEAQPPVRRQRQRVPLPQWKELPSTFFADAFQDALRGERPASSASPASDETSSPPPESGNGAESASTSSRASESRPSGDTPADDQVGSTGGWADVIGATTLEDEVKRLQQELARSVTVVGKYRTSDYKLAGEQLSLLATYMAVIAEYPGEIRWRDSAAGMAQLLSQASRQAAERSAESFELAVKCRDALTELVRGTPPADLPTEALPTDWSQIAQRDILMRRLELASDQRLAAFGPPTDATTTQGLHHEAQLVRLIARLLTRPGMEDGGDADYQRFCEELAAGARTILDGLPTSDANSVTAGVSAVKQSCVACHEAYRG